MNLKKWGPYVFLVGFVIALIVGLAGQSLPADAMATVLAILALLGVIVGCLNIGDKEVVPFLIAVIALLQVETALNVLNDVPVFAATGALDAVAGVIAALVLFIVPAALIVALITIYRLAGEGAFETAGEVFSGPKRRKR